MANHIIFEENIEGDDAKKKKNISKMQFYDQNQDYDEIMEESATVKWYDQAPEDPLDFKPLINQVHIDTLMKEARSVIHGESLAHETKMNKIGSSDQKWARSLLSKGAMADKVAAATVLIQDSPLHNLSILQNLVAMVKPAKKQDSLTAIETLTELFVDDLLLPDRKLRKFEQRPLSELDKMCSGNKDHRKKILLYWIYEHLLKETYGEFVKSLNSFAHDSIETHKEKAVIAMAKLLMGNPELENVLLTNIVNKLGDPSQKVASKVIYQLSQVLYNHPNMKSVVLHEIEKMLFRSNISSKAQYYGICFLNQFYLNKDDSKVAENLVRVYFSFFKACIKTGEVDTRMMSGILTGVRRCRPFLQDEAVQALQTHSHALHKLVHLASYTIALQALALLYQLGPTDRYYNSLYRKLSHPETLTTTHPALLLGLVYRSLNNDESETRVLAFLKRLLQLAVLSDANRACAILLVVARLSRRRKLPMSHEKQDKELETNVEKTENENTVDVSGANSGEKPIDSEETVSQYKESDADEIDENSASDKKIKKKKRRKDGVERESEMGEGKKVDIDQSKLKKTNSWLIGDKNDLLNEDDDEVYHDIPLEEDQDDHKKKIKNLMKKKKESSQGWLFRNNDKLNEDLKEERDEDKAENEDKEKDKNQEKKKSLEILIKKTKNLDKVINQYDPYGRNPQFCGAEKSVMTELLILKEHYHPSVRLFAEKIIESSIILYNGDPLKDFSIAHFLDRFAFKNPKKNPTKEQQDMDPQHGMKIRGSHPKFAVRRNYTPGGLKGIRVNSAAYLNEDVAHIPVDEKFLYDYLQMKRQARGDTGEDDEGAESDTGSVDSEDFNRYLDTLTGAANKNMDDSEEEEVEQDMDYMKEMVTHKKVETSKKKNKNSDKAEAMEEDEEDSLDEDGDDDDLNSLGSADIDDDGDSDLMFSDEEENEDIDDEEAILEAKMSKSNKKGKKNKDDDSVGFSEDDDDVMLPAKKGKAKGGKKGIESMFASAEEFAELLEETGSSRKQGTSQAMATNDNANVKQLNWEEKRDRWVKGYAGSRGRGRGRGSRGRGVSFRGRGGSHQSGDRGKGTNKWQGGNSFDRKRKNFGGSRGGTNKKFRK